MTFYRASLIECYAKGDQNMTTLHKVKVKLSARTGLGAARRVARSEMFGKPCSTSNGGSYESHQI